MIKSIVTLGAALACALLSTQSAHAANCATLSVSPAAPSIPTWNPLNPAAQEANFTATITRVSSSTKAIRLIFLDANSSAAPTRVGTTSGPRYDIVNVKDLAAAFPQGGDIDLAALKKAQLVKKNASGLKVLGKGDIGVALKVKADRVSARARSKIEGAGGSVETAA